MKHPRIKNLPLMELLKYEFDCCEVTGETGDLHLHHVIFRSHGGDDIRANIVCMTRELHDRYHQHDPEALRQVALHVNNWRHDTMLYLYSKLGEGGVAAWLQRHGLEV